MSGSRRDFLKYATLAAGALACTGGARRPRIHAESRPNIVLFLSDDHGYDYVGCNGNKVVHTPNMDRLAQEGMRFTQAFAGSPTCVPSRAVLYTGLMPFRNGAFLNHSRAYPGIRSLPHYLKALGYRVLLAGKTHIRPPSVYPFEYVKALLPPDPAFDRGYRSEGLDTEAVDRVLADHAAQRPETPLCLVVATFSPHVNWKPTEPYKPEEMLLPPYIVDTPMTRQAMTRYYSEVTATDKKLGACLGSLKKHGFEENTLVIYTSDQGPEWPHVKWNLYDAGIRVPFIVCWPGKIVPGTVSDAMISLCDITPTFIDIAGGNPIDRLDGKSFLPVLLDRTDAHRSRILASHSGDGTMNDFPMRCVRTKTHKYILNLKPQNTYTTHFTQVPDADHGLIWQTWVEKAKTDPAAAKIIDQFQHRPEEELYDLRTDPDEMHNIADDPANADMLATLRQQVRDWMADQGDEGIASEEAGRARNAPARRPISPPTRSSR